jgi:hypothetical protein
MNKFLTKIILSIFLISIASCGGGLKAREAYSIKWMKDNVIFAKHPNYEGRRSNDSINKYLKGFNNNPQKPEGEAGCVMVKLYPWKNDSVWGWGRHWSWEEWNSPITSSNGITLDHSKSESTSYLVKQKTEHPEKSDYWGEFIYIGPWKYVPKIGKEIRLVAKQSRIYGGITSFFESKTPENAKIPEMPEIKLARFPENNLDYCKVLWMKTYGYNAVADLKPNPWWPLFSKNYYRGTGKVIEAKE